MRAGFRSLTAALGVTALALGSTSCGDAVRQGRSPVTLIIDTLEGASGATPEIFGAFLLSDVVTLVERTVGGETVRVPTIFNDVGQVTLRTVMKDQGTANLGVGPTFLQAVTVRRYRVVFKRADGRNTPGVDVPYPFDGAVTATVTNIPSSVGFEVVRHTAKQEQPLIAMVAGGGRNQINTIAEITFYGTDTVGNEIQTTGTMSVNFSDFADPQ